MDWNYFPLDQGKIRTPFTSWVGLVVMSSGSDPWVRGSNPPSGSDRVYSLWVNLCITGVRKTRAKKLVPGKLVPTLNSYRKARTGKLVTGKLVPWQKSSLGIFVPVLGKKTRARFIFNKSTKNRTCDVSTKITFSTFIPENLWNVNEQVSKTWFF